MTTVTASTSAAPTPLTAAGGSPPCTYPAQRVRRLGVPGEVRGERIVHELDGILTAVDPQRVGDVGAALWQHWPGSDRAPEAELPDLLLGLDAGGIPPTVAVSLASGVPYQLAWKLDLDLPGKLRFTEPHATRTDVFSYADVHGRSVLLVDDEVTTGRTLANLTVALRAAGARVLGALCLVEDTSGGGRALLAGQGVALCALTTV